MQIDEKYIRLQLESAYSMGAIAAFDHCQDSENQKPSELKPDAVNRLMDMLMAVSETSL